MRKFVLLDRDGVINRDRSDYVKSVDEVEMISGAAEAIARLNAAGFEVAVISNQQGVAKGDISDAMLDAITAKIRTQVENVDGQIVDFFYCKHLAEANCACRKPKPGLILRAAEKLNFDPRDSWMIGDTENDIVAARAAGCRSILVLSGHTTAEKANHLQCAPDCVATDLADAIDRYILNRAAIRQKSGGAP